jgi:hypothetical protein
VLVDLTERPERSASWAVAVSEVTIALRERRTNLQPVEEILHHRTRLANIDDYVAVWRKRP